MSYNIHPIFVHFPIAFLSLYSFIKIAPVERWLPAVSWKHIERALLFAGVIGAFAALTTGESAEEAFGSGSKLVESHSLSANLTTVLYTTLLLGDVIAIFGGKLRHSVKSETFNNRIAAVGRFLQKDSLSKPVALLAFISLLLTGLLGGAIVYGSSADPLARFVLPIFGLR